MDFWIWCGIVLDAETRLGVPYRSIHSRPLVLQDLDHRPYTCIIIRRQGTSLSFVLPVWQMWVRMSLDRRYHSQPDFFPGRYDLWKVHLTRLWWWATYFMSCRWQRGRMSPRCVYNYGIPPCPWHLWGGVMQCIGTCVSTVLQYFDVQALLLRHSIAMGSFVYSWLQCLDEWILRLRPFLMSTFSDEFDCVSRFDVSCRI